MPRVRAQDCGGWVRKGKPMISPWTGLLVNAPWVAPVVWAVLCAAAASSQCWVIHRVKALPLANTGTGRAALVEKLLRPSLPRFYWVRWLVALFLGGGVLYVVSADAEAADAGVVDIVAGFLWFFLLLTIVDDLRVLRALKRVARNKPRPSRDRLADTLEAVAQKVGERCGWMLLTGLGLVFTGAPALLGAFLAAGAAAAKMWWIGRSLRKAERQLARLPRVSRGAGLRLSARRLRLARIRHGSARPALPPDVSAVGAG